MVIIWRQHSREKKQKAEGQKGRESRMLRFLDCLGAWEWGGELGNAGMGQPGQFLLLLKFPC
jgi:hypothetical protein